MKRAAALALALSLTVAGTYATHAANAADATGEATTAPSASAAAPAQENQASFVSRTGSQLQLDGRPFRFAGSNMYWLQLDDNVKDAAGQATYPTHFRIDDAMKTQQAMGGTVVRAWANSVGSPRSIQPTLGTFDKEAFESLDYAIAAAAKHNQRLILTLADNWDYYNGGKTTYTKWRDKPETAFFSDPQIISDYLRHIDAVTSHVNQYTGKAYRDDPTIMGWETGNEMWCQGCSGNFWDGSWTRKVADHIKKVAPNQLVVDGHGTDTECATGCLHEPSLDIPSVDIVDDHHYPMSAARVRDAAAAAAKHQRVYMVGEYDWTAATGGDSIATFTQAIEQSPAAAGSLMWAVIPHADTTGFVDHNDGYQYNYPGRNRAEKDQTAALVKHATTMRGRTLTAAEVTPAAVTPTVAWVPGTGVTLTWKGSGAAADYVVQRQASGGSWETVETVADQAIINGPTWTDTSEQARTSGDQLRYRVTPRALPETTH